MSGLAQVITVEVPGASASYRDTPRGAAEPVLMRVRIHRTPPSRTLLAIGSAVTVVVPGAWVLALAALSGLVSIEYAFLMASVMSGAMLGFLAISAQLSRGPVPAHSVEIGRRTIHAWTEGLQQNRDLRVSRADVVAIQIGWSDHNRQLHAHRLADGPLQERAAPFAVVARDRSGRPHALIEELDRVADAWRIAQRVHAALGPDVVLDVPREFFDPPPALAGSG